MKLQFRNMAFHTAKLNFDDCQPRFTPQPRQLVFKESRDFYPCKATLGFTDERYRTDDAGDIQIHSTAAQIADKTFVLRKRDDSSYSLDYFRGYAHFSVPIPANSEDRQHQHPDGDGAGGSLDGLLVDALAQFLKSKGLVAKTASYSVEEDQENSR